MFDCFHLLATVKSGVMNMAIQILLQDLLSVLLNMFPEVGILDDVVVLILFYYYYFFLGIFILFSIVVTPFSNPISSGQGFWFLHILANT